MAKAYNKKSKEKKDKEVNELIEKADIGIKNSFDTPEHLKELLDYMSKFYNYSLRNSFLIQEQFEGALAVGPYNFWKEKGFAVNKGEKGIKILVPTKLSDYFINEKKERVKLKDATSEEKKLIEQGEIKAYKGTLSFKQGYVFDISQTDAKAEDLPKIFPNKWLEGEVDNYDLMYKAMKNIAKKIGVKIIEPKEELGAVKGVSYPATKEVALNPRNTQLQNVKTLVHELAHAKLHTMETRDNYTVNEKEFQAEMAAYVVCSYFGLDTSEYSFRYIKDWTKDVELKDKEILINEVRETTKEYIDIIEETLINDKELSLSLEKENGLEKEIKDEKLINFLGKNRVVINEITKDELEKIISENNSIIFLQKDKELTIDNEIVATEDKGKYTDVYIGTDYELDDLIYIDDNKNLYVIKEDKDYDKNLYEIKEKESIRNDEKYKIDKSKEYETLIDLDLNDGSFIRKGTSFLIEGYKDGKHEIHFSRREGNIYIPDNGTGDMYYFNEAEIKNFTDLSKGKVIFKEQKFEENKNYDENLELTYDQLVTLESALKIAVEREAKDGSFVYKEKIEEILNSVQDLINEDIAPNEELILEQSGEMKLELTYGQLVTLESILNLVNTIEAKEGVFINKEKIEEIFNSIQSLVNEGLAFNEELILEQESMENVDDWKLTDKELEEVSFRVMKDNIEELMKENYGDFIKAIVSIETGIDDLEVLDDIYEKYMNDDFGLINDKFEDLKNELGKEDIEMIDEKKEKEIWKKIREHEEWIKSNGLRGQKLNLENENLKGMKLINLDLRDANFKGADMTQCVVYADLRGADLTGVKIDNSKWIGSNLNNVTIEANKLNLIEYQMEQDKDFHLLKMNNLKTKSKEKEMRM